MSSIDVTAKQSSGASRYDLNSVTDGLYARHLSTLSVNSSKDVNFVKTRIAFLEK